MSTEDTPFAVEADLRIRLKGFIRDTPDATDRSIALDFLEEIDDDEYEALFTAYITGLVEGLSDFRKEARRLNQKARQQRSYGPSSQ